LVKKAGFSPMKGKSHAAGLHAYAYRLDEQGLARLQELSGELMDETTLRLPTVAPASPGMRQFVLPMMQLTTEQKLRQTLTGDLDTIELMDETTLRLPAVAPASTRAAQERISPGVRLFVLLGTLASALAFLPFVATLAGIVALVVTVLYTFVQVHLGGPPPLPCGNYCGR
jgi:hypothetical protein